MKSKYKRKLQEVIKSSEHSKKEYLILNNLGLANNLNSAFKKKSNNLLALKNIFVTKILKFGDGFDDKVSLLNVMTTSIWLGVRRILVGTIKILDRYIDFPFAEGTDLPFVRTIHYGYAQLRVKSFSKGIDLRCKYWKREALTMILEEVATSNQYSKSKINFMEIGAASGIVSLFLAKILKGIGLEYNIMSIEPNLDNLIFLEHACLSNNLDISILPVAVGTKDGWIEFSNDGTRGLVGNEAQKSPGKYNNKSRTTKPLMSIDRLNEYYKNPEIVYVDAFLNEQIIIKQLLENFPGIQILLIEFDTGISDDTLQLLEAASLKIKTISGFNYLFKRVC